MTDTKKTTVKTTSKTEKHNDKKDENIFEKTAHSIRDKVHGLTDDVKEKAHHLTHHDDPKKSQSHTKPSLHPPKLGKTDSGSSSEDERGKATDPSSSKPGGPSSIDEKKDSASKPVGPPSSGEQKEDTAAGPPSSSKPPDSAAASGVSDDQKTTAAPPATKPPTTEEEKPAGPPSSGDAKSQEEKPTNTSAAGNSDDRVHVSFAGVTTVDDLLERIDDAVERAKIIVEDGKNKAAAKINEDKAAAAPAENASQPKQEEEPIRVQYGDIHKLEDLLALVNNQPGHRKVVLEGAPGQGNTVSIRTSNTPANDNEKKIETSTTQTTTDTPSSSTTEKKTETPSSLTTEKTTDTPTSTSATKEETTETPSSKTVTKTTEKTSSGDGGSSSRTDHIHVNIENVQSVDELLDRIDNAVQHVPVVIDLTPQEKDNSASIKSDQNDTKKDVEASLKFQKEVPETNEESNERLDRF